MGALEHPKGQRVIVPDEAEGFYLDHGWKHAGEAVTPEPAEPAEPAEPSEPAEPTEPTDQQGQEEAPDGGKPEADAGGSAGVPAKRTRATARKG